MLIRFFGITLLFPVGILHFCLKDLTWSIIRIGLLIILFYFLGLKNRFGDYGSGLYLVTNLGMGIAIFYLTTGAGTGFGGAGFATNAFAIVVLTD